MPKSQMAIAVKAGIDQRTVGRTLNCTHAISVDKLDGLAKAFGVQPWSLLAPGLEATVKGLSSMALEVALLYESLPKSKRSHLYATAQMLHNPEPEPEEDEVTPPEDQPAAAPTRSRRQSRQS